MSNENIDSPVDHLQQGHYMERDSPCLGNYILFPESQLQISQNVFLKLSAWIVLCPAAAPPGSSPVHVAFLLTVPI